MPPDRRITRVSCAPDDGIDRAGSLYPASIDGLEAPDSLIVYALAPDIPDPGEGLTDRVQGIPVRKKVIVKDRDARRHIGSNRAVSSRAQLASIAALAEN